jgi:hypothetical protein
MAPNEDVPAKGAGAASSDGNQGSSGFFVALPDDLTAAVDSWIAARPEPRPTRHEAVHHLIQRGLKP